MPYQTLAADAYLGQATEFLAACRERDPLAGMWDVGNVHWWWRDDRYRNPSNQRFWATATSTFGLLLLNEHNATFDYEFFPGLEATPDALKLFTEGLEWLERFELLGSAEKPSFYVRGEHAAFRNLAQEAGFVERGGALIQTYQRLATYPATVRLPTGFSVRPLCKSDLSRDRPPVLGLSAEGFGRVTRTPSYDPELHLVIISPEGEVAAECICWWDKGNAIGVFSPFEIAKAFSRRGLAQGFLAKGMELFSQRGVRLVKVSHDKRDRAAGRLYASLGFKAAFERKLFVQR